MGPRRFAFVAEVVDGVDAGRGVCRVHPEAMTLLGVRAWEPVELRGDGGGRAAALAGHLDWQAARNACVIDSLLAENLGVSGGDRVVVTPVPPVPATSVTLRALERVEMPATALRAALLGKAVVAGERESLLPQDFTQAFSQDAAEDMRRLRDSLGPAWRSLRVEVRATEPDGVVTIVPSTRLDWYGDTPAGRPAAAAPAPGDLVGLDTQRAELRELMELAFGNSALLDGLGVAPPRGVLLQGPVGVGKAGLTRSIAVELGVDAVTLAGLDLGRRDDLKAGVAAVGDAFAAAARRRVVLVEDVDEICPSDPDDATAVSAALLAALDETSGAGRFVVATTAAPEACDPALFAEGRLERRIDFPLPDRDVRRRILDVHTRSLPLATDVDLGEVAARTPGFAGADLHRLCRQAGLAAAGRLHSSEPASTGLVAQVTAADFADALSHVRPSTMGGTHLDTGDVSWADVGDAVELKQALTESVMWPVRFPDTFARLGLSPPRGVLLYGPPGCGKTYVVRALAGEAEANLLAVKGAELLSKWVGESEAGVRDVFRRARAAAPAIVFLDEIDALAPVRGASTDSGVTDRVVAALLTEIDGIEPMRGVAIVAATNRPDLVDPALLRPGRLERHVFVELPDAAARTEILTAACRKMPLDDGVDLATLAARGDGFSAADLTAVCREAGYAALHRDPQVARISAADFDAAMSRMRPSVDPGVVARLREFRSA